MSSNSMTCPCCGSGEQTSFFELPAVPTVCNQLYDTADQARAAQTGDLELGFCRACGLIHNRAFDSGIISYDARYDNALHFSPLFGEFARGLAKRLIETYGLQGKKIFEVGCGDGYFLDLMVKSGAGAGKGFDPSATEHSQSASLDPAVEIVPEHFRPGARQIDEPYAALLCRHVLEHIDEPVPFLREIRSAISDRDCLVYFEVPNAQWLLRDRSLWDVIYEHVTYWTPPSLTALFRRCGFEPLAVRSDYGDQFLMIEARPSEPEPSFLPDAASVREVGEEAERFAAYARELVGGWSERLQGLRREGKRAALWGAGSKGVTFSNIVGDGREAISCLVDLNARKAGRFVPGAAVEVVQPQRLTEIRPDVVLIANPLYENEIRQTVSELNLSPDFAVISG